MSKSVFISWSGDEARTIAESLQKFLKFVLANPPSFVASKDIKAGEVWFTEIAAQLDACDVGVIVVTPQSRLKPWLHFEAGAIAKRVGRSAAIPLLCGLAIGDLAGTPLAQLQALTMDRAGILKLCSRLNQLLEANLTEAFIIEAFDNFWPTYEGQLTDPAIWSGVEPQAHVPTTADLSVQLSQLSASISQLAERVERTNRGPAPLILGQGELATKSADDMLRIVASRMNEWSATAAATSAGSATSASDATTSASLAAAGSAPSVARRAGRPE